MKSQVYYEPLADAAAPAELLIHVSNVDELYAAVNNAANAGKTIVLAPNQYHLKFEDDDPLMGRLELQHNMTLRGQPGDPEQVVIDVTDLPLTSYKLTLTPRMETSPIRIGNGSNTIEWMTVQYSGSDSNIRALIQSDMDETPISRIRIANTILKASNIGLCIINRYPVCNNRVVHVEIESNEIGYNAVNLAANAVPRFASGLQIQNSHGVEGAMIKITMKNNHVHHNGNGVAVMNAAPRDSVSKKNRILINSENDRIENNGIGLALIGGNSSGVAGFAEKNSIHFDAKNTSVSNNLGTPVPMQLFDPGGVYAVGGSVSLIGATDGVNNNDVKVIFKDCRIEGNFGINQVVTFGYNSKNPNGPTGSKNISQVHLHGISNQATYSADDSNPDEPAGTNKATVYNQ